MGIDAARLQGLRVAPRRQHFSRDDARLYALGVGYGADPLDENDLDYAVDRTGFRVVPTMATIFADAIVDLTQACELERPELAVHAEQQLDCRAPLVDGVDFDVGAVITAVYDRGPERGAQIHMQAEASIRASGEPLYRATYVTIARGDGGFGGQAPPTAAGIALPAKPPTAVVETRVAENQALLYALNGDPNPIHTQPAIANRAGFEKPILHGLCTYGMACRAVLRSFCNNDPARMGGFDVRFAAPVYPGDTLRFEMWDDDDGVLFEARAPARDVVVLKNGRCRLID